MQGLNDFEFTDISQWEQQVFKDLNIKDINQLSAHSLHHEILQPPYVDFTTENRRSLVHSFRNRNRYSADKWKGSRFWVYMEQISSADAVACNQLSLEALSGGADGIILDIGGISDLGTLFSGISIPDCQLGITAAPDELNNLEDFLDSSNSEINGFLIVDRLLSWLDPDTNEILNLLNKFANCRKLVLMETPSKTGTLSEIAQLLSQGVYFLNTLLDRGVPIQLILQNIQFNLRVGDTYLWEICRIRCLRFLFNSIVTQYDVKFASKNILIHATTSDPSPFDSSEQSNNADIENLKLISNTTQAMAAILGGCDILTVDAAKPPAQDNIGHQRIARNVSHILREECFLHRVADPVAGSYYLEELTSNMMKHVWTDFQAIERAGGYLKFSSNEA